MTSKKQRVVTVAIGLIVLCAFTLGVLHLFVLRFDAGDIYPPYSSLRADPLGVKVLYQSLEEYPGITVSRNYKGIDMIDDWPEGTILFLGDRYAGSDRFPIDAAKALDQYIMHGGRVVVTLSPVNYSDERKKAREKRSKELKEAREKRRKARQKKAKEKKAKNKKDKDKEDKKETANAEKEAENAEKEADEKSDSTNAVPDEVDDAIERLNKETVLAKNWFGIDVYQTVFSNDVVATLQEDIATNLLPSAVSCHTFLMLSNVVWQKVDSASNAVLGHSDRDWQVIYERDGNPVMVESHYGKGSIVLSTISFMVSNEALRDERYPRLISWLIGGNSNVVFDEYHHGLNESPGVAFLIRKYNLEWFIGVLLVLAVLFVWKNSFSLVPSSEDETQVEFEELARGKGSEAGLVNLLRQNVSSRHIVQTCIEEWEKSITIKNSKFDKKLVRVKDVVREQNMLPIMQRSLTKAYNEISRIITEKPGG